MSLKSLKHIAITGAAGHIAYSLIFRLAAGDLLGPDQPLALHLLEVPEALGSLNGVVLELDDCCASFPLIHSVMTTDDPKEAFKGCDAAFLIGAKPRGPGMERRDLLMDNAEIFVEHGKALNEVASKDVVVLVVGNPCNTNCLIALSQAPKLDKRRFFSMSALDQNRLAVQLAKKAGVDLKQVSHATVWGNHSAQQVPDFVNTLIEGRPALEVIGDRLWCEEELVPCVQKRGAEVIAARGKSSAASAAHAALQCMRHILFPTAEGETFSCGVLSDGNPYGVAEGIVYSFPCVSRGTGVVEIAPGFAIDSYLREKMVLSEKELLEEKRELQCKGNFFF